MTSPAMITVPTSASRFALLQIDSDSESDTSEPGKSTTKAGKEASGKHRQGKTGAAAAGGKAAQSNDKKKDKKKKKKEQQQSEANVVSIWENVYPMALLFLFIVKINLCIVLLIRYIVMQ